MAAVRVRDGRVVDTFASLVKPDVPITAGAVDTHGIRPTDVSIAPRFPDLWPKLAAFCGDDIVVAHNRYAFDFKILDRMAAHSASASTSVPTTRSRSRVTCSGQAGLSELARVLRIDAGTSHRALDDARTLAQVFLELGAMKARRARKTSLTNLLDLVGLGLALCDRGTLCAEALLFAISVCRTRWVAIARVSRCTSASVAATSRFPASMRSSKPWAARSSW